MAPECSSPRRPSFAPFAALLLAVGVACGQGPDPTEAPPVRPKNSNRLSSSTSPYLRQHARNPVDWYPWGQEALARAKRENKPIFLSIGYSACHWCHVMERESFENEATAALLNAHFVCIKVDREERPDLDEVYMTAVQAMTGNGGWPMSVWLTPDLQPFYGGTYFPPADQHGRPGFPRVVQQLAKVWQERREDCEKGALQLTEHLRQVLQPANEDRELPDAVPAAMREQSASLYDADHGGFAAAPQHAPKFPHAAELQVLLRLAAAGDDVARSMALTTLDRMAGGGMFDQLGHGFHRYSTDREWLVPHFEKMLYDNALLTVAYVDAHRLTKDPRYAQVARATLDYVLRELRDPAGGFWSSQDADSEGVEGKYFVFTAADFERVLGDDAELAMARWGVTREGNWEGTNVLHEAVSIDALAARFGLEPSAVTGRLERARRSLLADRSRRVPPATDDKVLAAWNGLAISAFSTAAEAFGDERHLRAAQTSAGFVLDRMVVDGRLRRSYRDGRADGPAFLEDHAFVADGLLTLFEVDHDPRWLVAARDLLQTAIRHYGDDADGGFYFTADDHEALLARSKTATESSTPSGVAVVARALVRAGALLGDAQMTARGERVLRAQAALLHTAPVAAPSLVLLVQWLEADPREVVIAGAPDDPRTRALLAAARSRFPRFGVLACVHDGNRELLEQLSPIFVGKSDRDGAPVAYVCRRGVCEAPTADPAELGR